MHRKNRKISYKIPSGVTQITQRHVLDVGDVPGHQVTLAEYHSKYTNEAPGPVYGGVKAVETTYSLQADLVNGTGRVSGYGVTLLENGDKTFARSEQLLHSTVAPDGARKSAVTAVLTLTGGTGKFKGIQGTLKQTTSTDLKTGTGETVAEGEYWIEN
jgi:hypothetical protein